MNLSGFIFTSVFIIINLDIFLLRLNGSSQFTQEFIQYA